MVHIIEEVALESWNRTIYTHVISELYKQRTRINSSYYWNWQTWLVRESLVMLKFVPFLFFWNKNFVPFLSLLYLLIKYRRSTTIFSSSGFLKVRSTSPKFWVFLLVTFWSSSDLSLHEQVGARFTDREILFSNNLTTQTYIKF